MFRFWRGYLIVLCVVSLLQGLVTAPLIFTRRYMRRD
jgi:hypothetical protein